MTLREAVAAWLTHSRVERQLSPRTLAIYALETDQFMAAEADRAAQDIGTVDTQDIQSWLADQHRQGCAPSTAQRKLSTLRCLFRYVQRKRWREDDPTVGVKAPKAKRKLPNILDPDEAKQLVEIDTSSKHGWRDRAMLELFYGSGLRLSELANLRWGAVDLHEGMVRVTGKGNKTRVVPLTRHACEALEGYRDTLTQTPSDDHLLFPNRHGEPLAGSSLAARLKKRAKEQGIWKNVHPHLLRHSFASHVLESSGNLRAVQEMLGHANIATTQIYTHLDFQHLAKVVDDAHPRSKKK